MSENKFTYTAEQLAAIKHRGKALLVSAAAGSGKTKVLVERLLNRVEQGDNIDEFLVITYTRAAASELREKIYEEILARLAQSPDSRRLRRQSMLCRGASIGTIHSFCTEILRESAHLVRLQPDFRVADESESELIKADVLENILNAAYEGRSEDGGDGVEKASGHSNHLLDYEVSTEGEKSGFTQLVDMVSPGRDDKRLGGIILEAHAKLQSNPNPEKWVKTQKEMLKMSAIKDVSETIWGEYLMKKARSLSAYWYGEIGALIDEMKTLPDFEKAYGPSLIITHGSIKAFLDALDIGWDEAMKHRNIEFPTARVKGYEEQKAVRQRCKDSMKKCGGIFECSSKEHIEDMQAIAPSMTALLDLMLTFDQEYGEEKRRRGLVDFSDLEHLTVSVLIDRQTGTRTELAKSISRRYKEIMVDEYQDVNAVQELIFSAVSQDGKNIFMVGDVKQSIYRFRLADPSIFLDKYRYFDDAPDFDEEFGFDSNTPGLDAMANLGDELSLENENQKDSGNDIDENRRQGHKIMLSQNFRSRGAILEAVNFVFGKIMSIEFGEMDYTHKESLIPGREDIDISDSTVAVEMNLIDLSEIEQDDDEESPAKTYVEASYIAKRIVSLTDGSHSIPDGKGGERPIECSDIVILLRSIRGKAWQYASALTECGIAVDLPGGEGFFQTVEISSALSLLSVIDNPRQDIALAAALRGPIYGLTEDELALIRASLKDSDFYNAIVNASSDSEGAGGLSISAELRAKCAEFLADIEGFALLVPDMPADRFIWHVYNKTSLIERVGAMRGGEKRRNNLIALAESARMFEQSGYKGLFGFLTYIRGLVERGAEPIQQGGGGSGDAGTLAVRIMSIHKSKGLEFPVVIMADTSKRLNNKDAVAPLVIHPEFGVGQKRLDAVRRIEYTTIARMAIQSKLTSEMMAEELRVLYVAMTRAREKLIITATFRDASRELEKLSSLGVAPQTLEEVKSMAGWILAAVGSASGGQSETFRRCPIDVSIVGGVGEDSFSKMHSGHKIPETQKADEKKTDKAEDTISSEFMYPYGIAPNLPSKLTATGLKGLSADSEAAVLYIEEKAENRKEWSAYSRPIFIRENKGLTAAERGTALHMALQHIDFNECKNFDGILSEIQRLSDSRILTSEQIASIDAQKIMQFFKSDIGRRVLGAENTWREFKFSIMYPAEKFFEGGGDDEVLLQGVVDCYFEEKGMLTVVDFKTDYVTSESMGKKAAYYAPQINVYAEALEKMTGKQVKERVIYFFCLDEAYGV